MTPFKSPGDQGGKKFEGGEKGVVGMALGQRELKRSENRYETDKTGKQCGREMGEQKVEGRGS